MNKTSADDQDGQVDHALLHIREVKRMVELHLKYSSDFEALVMILQIRGPVTNTDLDKLSRLAEATLEHLEGGI